MKKILPLFIALIAFAITNDSCKKDELVVDNPQQTENMIADHRNVKQLEVALLTATNFRPSKAIYSGTFAGQSVKIKVLENKLGFLVPETALGNNTLKVDIDGKTYSVDFTVTALASIPNADAFIATKRNDFQFTQAKLTEIATATANMPSGQYQQQNAAILTNTYGEFTAKLNAASAADKAQLAKIIAANPILFAPLEDITQYIDTLSFQRIYTYKNPEVTLSETEKGIKTRTIASVILVLTAGVIIEAALVSVTITAPVLIIATAAAVVSQIYNTGNYSITQAFKSIDFWSDFTLNGTLRTTNNEVFESGRTYTFDMKANYKNLNQQNVQSTAPVMKSIVASLDTFNSAWNNLMTFVPCPLIGSPFHIRNVSSTQTKNLDVRGKFLTVKNITNPKVTVIVDNTGEQLKATFSTNEVTDQAFEYDIVYNNPNVKRETAHFSGTVKCVGKLSKINNETITYDGQGRIGKFYFHGIQSMDYVNHKATAPGSNTIITLDGTNTNVIREDNTVNNVDFVMIYSYDSSGKVISRTQTRSDNSSVVVRTFTWSGNNLVRVNARTIGSSYDFQILTYTYSSELNPPSFDVNAFINPYIGTHFLGIKSNNRVSSVHEVYRPTSTITDTATYNVSYQNNIAGQPTNVTYNGYTNTFEYL